MLLYVRYSAELCFVLTALLVRTTCTSFWTRFTSKLLCIICIQVIILLRLLHAKYRIDNKKSNRPIITVRYTNNSQRIQDVFKVLSSNGMVVADK